MMIEQAKDVSTISAVLPLIEAYWRFEQIDHFDQHHLARLLQQLIEQPQHGSLWLAHKDNQCIAYLLLTYQFSLEYGGMVAEIDELFVLPSARSLGVGKAILQVAEQHLREKSFVKFQLQIANENIAAMKFYRQIGFSARADFYLMDKAI